MDFKLVSKYKPTGDQPQAIKSLSEGLENGLRTQVLRGVTGSGKTFYYGEYYCRNKPSRIGDLSQQDACRTAVQRIQGVFSLTTGWSFFVSYYDYYMPESYTLARPLHRKGNEHKRRNRQAASLGNLFAFREEGHACSRKRFLHLRSGRSGRVLSDELVFCVRATSQTATRLSKSWLKFNISATTSIFTAALFGCGGTCWKFFPHTAPTSA